MPTEDSEWEILAGDPVVEESTLTLVDAGTTGTPGARHTLAHPDDETFPILTYHRNPDRIINFDQDPLYPPGAELVRTQGTTLAFVTRNQLDDVVVTEVWEGSSSRASMPASFFRRLYELSINLPAIEEPEIFVRWSPRSRNAKTYDVVIVGLRVGGQNFKLDVKEWGVDQLTNLDTVPTGILDKTVELDMLLVAEVDPEE